MEHQAILEFTEGVRRHLTDELVPFWERMRDEEQGGFYGQMSCDGTVERQADKGGILNSRILWFFANAYRTLGEERLLEDAAHAYRFLREHCLDGQYGGVFWSVTRDGRPADDSKHTYNQAFAIYALSSYYDASGDEEALALTGELRRLVEERCTDEYGYQEAFDRRFRPVDNEKLSENGVMAEKTMNTLLHVMEAYTELYRVGRDGAVAMDLKRMLRLIAEKVYNRELGRQEVFFDREWHSLLDLHSYGHDIEAAWLIDRTLEILGDAELTAFLSPVTERLTRHIYERAYREHSLANEEENGIVDATRIWWVQAEAIVGFYNGYQKDRERTEYLEAAMDIWNFVRARVMNRQAGSEWFWALAPDHTPLEKPMVSPWKCPYHNGRMCMEIIRRTEHDTRAVLYTAKNAG